MLGTLLADTQVHNMRLYRGCTSVCTVKYSLSFQNSQILSYSSTCNSEMFCDIQHANKPVFRELFLNILMSLCYTNHNFHVFGLIDNCHSCVAKLIIKNDNSEQNNSFLFTFFRLTIHFFMKYFGKK